jgi:hypothetical protein
LKPEQSTAARSMRAVSLAILLVTSVTFFALVYSAYEDYGSLTSVSHGTSSGKVVISGNTAQFFLNFTVGNKGLLPFRADMSCPSGQAHVTCVPTSVNLKPGTNGTLHFVIAVSNYTQMANAAGGLHMNGTVSFELVPFASLSLNLDFGQFVTVRGG